MKLYIAVLDSFPDYMTPTLVAHAILGAHLEFYQKHKGEWVYPSYVNWLDNSFKKCVVRVSQKEFNKITELSDVFLAHENKTLNGVKACAVVCPRLENHNVLKYAKLWSPKKVE